MTKYCKNCGNELREDATFCDRCGMNAMPVNSNQGDAQTNDTNATVSMICGVIGLFVAGIILGIIAIVFAQKSKANTNGVLTGKAKAGFILGIIDVACVVVGMLLTF